MNEIGTILLVLLVGILVWATAYYLLKLFFEREYKNVILETKKDNKKLILPLRLQAYERLILLLERISPNSLVIRAQNINSTAFNLHTELLSIIRTEFEHNLSQQLYISKEAWNLILNAKENVIKLINLSAQEIPPDAPATQLSNRIFTAWIQINPTPTSVAIDFLKDEAQKLF
ncbi:MAG: hypothetical protein N3A01_09160 [Bacteroidales bacterium]|nr:hypothetical protein [Bacteroidales bacterium]